MGRTSLRTRRLRRNAAAAVTERNTAIEQMNSALKRKFESIERKAGDARDDNLRYYYQLGQELVEIRDNPEKYGRNGYRLLEDALATQARTLRKAAMFARTYSESEFNALLTRRNDIANFSIHWGHLSYLLGFNTRQERDEWTRRAVEELLDPPALHAAMKRARGGNRRAHGRTHAIPKTLTAGIRQIHETTRIWLEKNEKVWNGEDNSVFAEILAGAPDKFTNDHLEMIVSIGKMMKKVIRAGKANIRKVEAVRKHVATCIRNQGRNSEAAGEHNGRQQRSIDLDEQPRRRGGALAGATS